MQTTSTFFRRLVPAALLLASLSLASCGMHKDCDPHPKNKCGTTTPTSSTTKPGGNS